MSDSTRLEGVVSGRVQGVGFRFYVQKKAQSLSLNGEVKNRGDGKVEFWAEGPKDALDQLLAHVEQGPTLSHVSSVETTWGTPQHQTTGFHIAY